MYANAPAPTAALEGVTVSKDVRKGYRRAFGLEEGEAEEEEKGEAAPGEKRLSAIGDDCPMYVVTAGSHADTQLL